VVAEGEQGNCRTEHEEEAEGRARVRKVKQRRERDKLRQDKLTQHGSKESRKVKRNAVSALVWCGGI
jgi:hypothetical protein